MRNNSSCKYAQVLNAVQLDGGHWKPIFKRVLAPSALKCNSTEITQLLPEFCISSWKLHNNKSLQITQETTEVLSLFQTCKFQYEHLSLVQLNIGEICINQKFIRGDKYYPT